MKVIITGHTGFIGTHLARDLGNADIVGISRSTPNEASVKSITQDLVNLQMAAVEQRRGWFQGASVLVHLSAYRPLVRSKRTDSFEENMKVNVLGTLNALLLAQNFRATHFVLASTKSVYKESQPPVSETHPTEPTTNYGRSKLLAESLCKAFAELNPLSCTALRIASVFGPGMDCNLVFASFLNRALRDEPIEVHRHASGFEYLDLVYVKDVVAAIEKALYRQHAGTFDTVNIGSGSYISTYELANKIIESTDSKSKVDVIKTNETRTGTRLSIDKASAAIDWKPRYDMNSAIVDLLPSWHCREDLAR